MNTSLTRKTIVALLQKGQAHITVQEALKGLKPELRNVRIAPGFHTIYEQMEHLRISQEDILRYIMDPQWKSLNWPEEYWPPEIKRLSEKKWKETIVGFKNDLKALINLVQDLDIDLTSKIHHTKDHTYLREILLVADHNAYHLGQIVLTRKMLGDWPM